MDIRPVEILAQRQHVRVARPTLKAFDQEQSLATVHHLIAEHLAKIAAVDPAAAGRASDKMLGLARGPFAKPLSEVLAVDAANSSLAW